MSQKVENVHKDKTKIVMVASHNTFISFRCTIDFPNLTKQTIKANQPLQSVDQSLLLNGGLEFKNKDLFKSFVLVCYLQKIFDMLKNVKNALSA